MPMFWEVILVLEDTCNFPVISAVTDGVSQNKTCYRMHDGLMILQMQILFTKLCFEIA